MSDFSLHHRQAASAAPKDFSPKMGELVSAKFSEDNQWCVASSSSPAAGFSLTNRYRAKVKKSSALKKEATLSFIDYGNEEQNVPFSRIRPLDAKFKALPGQAREARLSFVKLVPRSSEYGGEAWRRFASLTEGRKLVANVDQKEGSLLHLRLIDPSDPNAADDPLACINADLVREGEPRPRFIADWQVSLRSTNPLNMSPRTLRSSESLRMRRRGRRRTAWGSLSESLSPAKHKVNGTNAAGSEMSARTREVKSEKTPLVSSWPPHDLAK